jgi:hypothetical protein
MEIVNDISQTPTILELDNVVVVGVSRNKEMYLEKLRRISEEIKPLKNQDDFLIRKIGRECNTVSRHLALLTK